MIAAGLSFALFLYWIFLGLPFLLALDSRRNLLRTMLLAPAAGAAVVLLPFFWLSRSGLPVRDFGGGLAATLGLLAAVSLWRIRPRLPWRKAMPYAAILVLSFLLTGFPIFEFGDNWLSYGNNDMTNYVLAAQRLVDYGFFDIPDTKTFAENRDATLHYWIMHAVAGARPGSELLLASVVGTLGKDGFRVYMPLMLALHMALISAAGGLLLTHRRRRRIAAFAMFWMACSALITLGTLYQLIAQVYGMTVLCLAATLVLRQPDTTRWKTAWKRGLLLAAVLSSLAIIYPEIVPFLVLTFLLYQGIALLKRESRVREALPAWCIALAGIPLLLGSYFQASINFLYEQTLQADRSFSPTETLFPFYLVPSGFANLWGLLAIAQPASDLWVSVTILAGFLLTVVAAAFAIRWAMRLEPAAVTCLLMFLVAVVLAAKSSNFGLYKLAMFIQPFLIGTFVLGCVSIRRGLAVVPFALALVSMLAQFYYVDRSRGSHGGLVEIPMRPGSRLLDETAALKQLPPDARITSDTANVIAAKIQSLYARPRRIDFPSRDFYPQFTYTKSWQDLARTRPIVFDKESANRAMFLLEERLALTRRVSFDLKDPQAPESRNEFLLDLRAQPDGARQHCFLISTASQNFLNRRHFDPNMRENFLLVPWQSIRNHLVFVSSRLGQSYYLEDRRQAAFYQLEPDPIYPNRTVSGTGRHILLQVIQPSAGGRIVMDFTATWNSDGDNSLPPAAVIGQTRERLPLVGRGSARVISPPIVPQRIEGVDFLAIDMGRDGKAFRPPRRGLMALFGNKILLDIRRITGFSRDLSYISEEEYRQLQPPAAISEFPNGLLHPDLEYSGIYEDGWVSEHSVLWLGQQPDQTNLSVYGMFPKIGSEEVESEVTVSIDGQEIHRRTIRPGEFRIDAHVPYAPGRRRVELQFSALQKLPAPDGRPVAGRLQFVGFQPGAEITEAEISEIVPRGEPIQLGKGWYPLERFGGQTFRWVDTNAEFEVKRGGAVTLDVEAGPSLGRDSFVLAVGDDQGRRIIELPVAGRQQVTLPLPTAKPGRYRLAVDSPRKPVPDDPRILNFRVFRLATKK